MLPPAKIQNSSVQNSLVAEGSVIVDSRIQDSVIGIRSFVDRGASVKDTVFMGADYYPWQAPEERVVTEGPERSGIGEDSHIEGAIIDKNVSIGKRCRITNREGIQEGERDDFYIRDGIVVIPKNVQIPDDTII
jgi:glucose-1-phosphate adenylyltransferase